MMSDRPFLFDITRSIATGWTGRRPTGIDRVCDAYLAHYGKRAHAVIQHRGIVRALDEELSDSLFDLLADRGAGFRVRLARLAPAILAGSAVGIQCAGKVYLNVGHTDFDLASHHRWIRQRDLKAVYLVHDLIPIEDAALCTPHAVHRHTGRVVNALQGAAGIIANSRSTVESIERFAKAQGLPVPPVLSAHLGVDRFADVRPIRGGHFVCVGTIEPRKNHLMLLRVWQRLIASNAGDPPRLVLIGQWGGQSAPIRELLRGDKVLARQVTVLDHCSDEEMAGWIRTARAVLLPTLAEGFGLPLAEAMALGTPVIASDLPCFREIGQKIPLLLKPADEAAWSQGISAFMDSEGEARRQKRLLAHYQPPRWDDHFSVVDNWIRQVVCAYSGPRDILAENRAGVHDVAGRAAAATVAVSVRKAW